MRANADATYVMHKYQLAFKLQLIDDLLLWGKFRMGASAKDIYDLVGGNKINLKTVE